MSSARSSWRSATRRPLHARPRSAVGFPAPRPHDRFSEPIRGSDDPTAISRHGAPHPPSAHVPSQTHTPALEKQLNLERSRRTKGSDDGGKRCNLMASSHVGTAGLVPVVSLIFSIVREETGETPESGSEGKSQRGRRVDGERTTSCLLTLRESGLSLKILLPVSL